jgi:hypothetical protein
MGSTISCTRQQGAICGALAIATSVLPRQKFPILLPPLILLPTPTTEKKNVYFHHIRRLEYMTVLSLAPRGPQKCGHKLTSTESEIVEPFVSQFIDPLAR